MTIGSSGLDYHIVYLACRAAILPPLCLCAIIGPLLAFLCVAFAGTSMSHSSNYRRFDTVLSSAPLSRQSVTSVASLWYYHRFFQLTSQCRHCMSASRRFHCIKLSKTLAFPLPQPLFALSLRFHAGLPACWFFVVALSKSRCSATSWCLICWPLCEKFSCLYLTLVERLANVNATSQCRHRLCADIAFQQQQLFFLLRHFSTPTLWCCLVDWSVTVWPKRILHHTMCCFMLHCRFIWACLSWLGICAVFWRNMHLMLVFLMREWFWTKKARVSCVRKRCSVDVFAKHKCLSQYTFCYFIFVSSGHF